MAYKFNSYRSFSDSMKNISLTKSIHPSEYLLTDDFLTLPISMNFSELEEIKRKVCMKFEHIQVVVKKLVNVDNISILFFSKFYNAVTEQYNRYCDTVLVEYGISPDMYEFEFDYLFDSIFSVETCIENYLIFKTSFHRIIVVLFFFNNILKQLQNIKNRRAILLSRSEE